ncbi:hypothetical protein ACEQ8H_004210 [Pleosporales sp. CAS-2024a]
MRTTPGLALTAMLLVTASAVPVRTHVSQSKVSIRPVAPRSAATTCGEMYVHEEDYSPVYCNGHYENVDPGYKMGAFINWSAGICMVFDGRDAQGALRWSGGPGQEATTQVDGAQSYFCY